MVKIKRSIPAPPSLEREKNKKSGKYNLGDVVEQLKKDSYNKCYICGIKNLQDPVVEHRIAHNGDRDLMFDWDNLFYSCHHCNSMKNNERYCKDTIDCARKDPELHVEEFWDGKNVIVSNLDDDIESKITAELLNDVFNNTNTAIRTNAIEVRLKYLKMEMLSFEKLINKYLKDQILSNRLLVRLGRTSQFAAFKRTYVRKMNISFKGRLDILIEKMERNTFENS